MTFIIILMNSLFIFLKIKWVSTWVEFLSIFKEKSDCFKKTQQKKNKN
jgi:hypothetical protein